MGLEIQRISPNSKNGLGTNPPFAPCQPDGEVFGTDGDTKEATCKCSRGTCDVDSRNIVVPGSFKPANSLTNIRDVQTMKTPKSVAG